MDINVFNGCKTKPLIDIILVRYFFTHIGTKYVLQGLKMSQRIGKPERSGKKLRTWIKAQQKLVPDLIHLMAKRYQILQLIEAKQPIGRRNLAQVSELTERTLRKETDFLKEQNLVVFSTAGMSLSYEGSRLLREMDVIIRELLSLHELEEELQHTLSVKKVIIVAGDSYQSPWIKKDLGRVVVEQMKRVLGDNSIVAVTGGTTLAAVAEVVSPDPKLKSSLYVPARGGLGEDHENQANTICSKMAQQSGGKYRLLHVPEQLSKEAYESILLDPQIAEVVGLIRSARMIIHGIGEANTMAKRRKSSEDILTKLDQKQAVAEAFGYYFDNAGEIVYKADIIGLHLEDVKQADHILAVAGGSNKAKAILAFLKHGVQDVLITDEGAARGIQQLINK